MTARLQEAPSPAVLKAVARAELRALAAELAGTQAGQSVHGARRRIKRLRSLLRLLRTPLGEEAFSAANSSLREAADALAGRRRAEALVGAARRLGGGRRPGAAWRTVAEAHREDVAAGGAADGGLARARQAVAVAAKALGGARLQRADGPVIGEAFLASYRKARKRLAHGFADGTAEDLHEARKHVIHHLHHLDLLGAHLDGAERRAAALEKLREALGDLNDLDELGQLAAEGEPLPESALKLMAKRRATLLKRAEAAARRLFRHKPKAFGKRIGALWALGGE